MTRPLIQQQVLDATGVTLVTTAETVVATISGITSHDPDACFLFEGSANVTGGTSTTAVQLRVRRGSLTGAQVGATSTSTLAGTATVQAACQVDDRPGEVANATYVLTAQLVGAAANGSTGSANLSVTNL